MPVVDKNGKKIKVPVVDKNGKKIKSAGFGRKNETFLAWEAIFIICFSNFRGIAGPKLKKNHSESGAESGAGGMW